MNRFQVITEEEEGEQQPEAEVGITDAYREQEMGQLLEGIVGSLEEPSANQQQCDRNEKEEDAGTAQQKPNNSGNKAPSGNSKFCLLRNPMREADAMHDNGQKMAENEAGVQCGAAVILHQEVATTQQTDNRGKSEMENLQQQSVAEKATDKQTGKKVAVATSGQKPTLTQEDRLTDGTEKTARKEGNNEQNPVKKFSNTQGKNRGFNPVRDEQILDVLTNSAERGANAQEADCSPQREHGMVSAGPPHSEPMDVTTCGGSESFLVSPVESSAAYADRRAPKHADIGEKEKISMHAASEGKLTYNLRQPGTSGKITKDFFKKQATSTTSFDQAEVQQNGNTMLQLKKSTVSKEAVEAVNKARDTYDRPAVDPTVEDDAPHPFLPMQGDQTGERDHGAGNTVPLRQMDGHQLPESGPENSNTVVDTIEGSGEHNPTEGKGASQTWSQDGHNQTASKLTRSSARKGETEFNPPTSESASGKCLYNKEISAIPSLSGNHSVEMEVHPLVRRRRNSDTAISIGKITNLASEEAMEMGENDGISDDDSISLKKEDKDRTIAREGDLKPQEEKETEPIRAEQQKQSTRWQVMARPGPSSAKGTRGEELVLNAQKKVQVQLSNRFEAVGLMDDAGNEKQGQTECVNSDIVGKQFFLSEQYGEKTRREGKVVQIVEKEDDWQSQHAAGELPETSAREEISSTRSPVVERVNSSMHIPDNNFKEKGPQQVMVGTHQVERKILDDLSGTKEQEKGEGTRNAAQAAMGENLRIDAVSNARTANTTGDPVNSRRDGNPGFKSSTYATMEESWKTGEDTNDSVAKDGDFDHVQWAMEAGHVSFRKAKEKKHRKLEDKLFVTAMHGDGQMISEVRQSFSRMLAEDSQVGSKEIASSTASIHGGLVEGSGENNQEMSNPENNSALSPHGRQQLGSNSRLEWQQSDSRSSYNPCNGVSVEAPRGAEILKNSGDNSQEVSQPGNEQELSPDGFLQLGTIHSKERAIQANLIAKDVEPIPHRVVMLDEKEDTYYGLCGFNKEPSMVPSLENFQLRVQQISGSERHQEKPSTGINQSRDPSQEFHEKQSSEIHPLVARRRKSDSDISYSPSKDSSLEKDESSDVVHITAVEEQTMIAVNKNDNSISVGAEFGADFPVKPQAVDGDMQESFHVNRVHGQRENFFGNRETSPAGKSYAIEPPVVPAAGKSNVRCSLKGERDMKLTTPAEVVPAFAEILMHGDGQQKAERGSGAKHESGASNKNNFLGALQCIAERQDNATIGISEMHEGLKMGSNVFKANMQQQIMDDKGEKLVTVGKEANFSISATSRFSGHGRLDDVAGTGYVLDDSALLNGDQQNIQRGGENTQKITVRKHKLKKKAKPVLTGLVPVMVIENDEVFLKEAEPAASPQLVSCHSSLAEENVHVSKIAAEKYDRQEGHDENDPNMGLNLTVCGFNKELSFVPSNAGTSSFTFHAAHAKKDDPGGDNLVISSMQPLADSDSDNLEVHPCIARRRKSESSLDHGNWNSLHASEPVESMSKEKTFKPQSIRPDDMGKPTGLEEGGGMVLDKRKHLEKEKIRCHEEPAKTFQRWQLVNNEGISGAKDRQGKEIGSEDDPKNASISISNRFHVISKEDDEAQIRTAKQGRTEAVNSATKGKQISSDVPLSAGTQQEDAAETLLVGQDIQHMGKAYSKLNQNVKHTGMNEALAAASVGGEGLVTPVEETNVLSRELTVPVEGRLLHELVQTGEGEINTERTTNNAKHAQCYVEHGCMATDRNNKKKKSLQKHIIEGSAQDMAHATADVKKGGFSVDRVEKSSNQVHGAAAARKQKQNKSKEKSRDRLEKPAMHEDVQQLSESGGPQGEKDQTNFYGVRDVELMAPIGSVRSLEPAAGMSVQADVGEQIQKGFFIPSTRATVSTQGGNQQLSEREQGEQIMPVDMLEGSGDYSPINEQRASQTRLSEQNWVNPITVESRERVTGYIDEPPNLESASGKCLYNTEMNHVPSVSGTQYAELEVHPLVRQRRHSDTSTSLGRMGIASEEAVHMGENDGVSEEDSISKANVTISNHFHGISRDEDEAQNRVVEQELTRREVTKKEESSDVLLNAGKQKEGMEKALRVMESCPRRGNWGKESGSAVERGQREQLNKVMSVRKDLTTLVKIMKDENNTRLLICKP
ncbi:hypothetical protein SCA6_020599 [Theobroma cacao]